MHFRLVVVASIEATVNTKCDVSSALGLQGDNIEDSEMETNVEEWMIVALCCDTAPEFRAVQKTVDEAYSGPEQRRRTPYRLQKMIDHRLPAVTARADTALAA